MPVILAIQEAEIGRIVFEASPGKKFSRPPFQQKKLGIAAQHLSFQLLQEV
jgi:hypothetical protein